MKYLKVISAITRSEGEFAFLERNLIHLVDRNPIIEKPLETRKIFPVEEVQYFLPLIQPPNIIAVGLNYREHAKESKMDIPVAPVIFLKATSALIGNKQPIIITAEAPNQVD